MPKIDQVGIKADIDEQVRRLTYLRSLDLTTMNPARAATVNMDIRLCKRHIERLEVRLERALGSVG